MKNEISFQLDPARQVTTQADFSYKITPDTIAISDTGQGKVSVANDIEAVLRKIEFWHQGSISSFKITYQDVSRHEHGAWHPVRWDGQRASYESDRT
jgi:hypothetical protein